MHIYISYVLLYIEISLHGCFGLRETFESKYLVLYVKISFGKELH